MKKMIDNYVSAGRVPAGRDLDAFVAKILGWRVITCEEAIALSNEAFPNRPSWDDWYVQDMYIKEEPIPSTGFRGLPCLSTSNADVQEVMQYLSRQGIEVVITEGFGGNLSACMIYQGIATSYPCRDVFLHLANIEESHRRFGYLCVRVQAETIPLAICYALLKAMPELRGER